MADAEAATYMGGGFRLFGTFFFKKTAFFVYAGITGIIGPNLWVCAGVVRVQWAEGGGGEVFSSRADLAQMSLWCGLLP